jgi:hypothetical protein
MSSLFDPDAGFSCFDYQAEVHAWMAGFLILIHPMISPDMLMQDLTCQIMPRLRPAVTERKT